MIISDALVIIDDMQLRGEGVPGTRNAFSKSTSSVSANCQAPARRPDIGTSFAPKSASPAGDNR